MSFSTLVNREDFRANPIKAIFKRLFWRTRWIFIKSPWTLTLPNGSKIETPKIGTGALIYYLGYSEPEIANFINYYLKPGMCFVDIGAHLGEYCLLASSVVNNKGKVYAFEPNPDIIPFLFNNIKHNSLENVVVVNSAVSSSNGQVILHIHKEASMSSLRKIKSGNDNDFIKKVTVSTVCLNSYFFDNSRKIDIIKVDVEGAELDVIIGASCLLKKSIKDAPIWILEFNPLTNTDRLKKNNNVLEILWNNDYNIFEFNKSHNNILDSPPNLSLISIMPDKTTNLIASKKFLFKDEY
jgi:FkbM family methyltransferase